MKKDKINSKTNEQTIKSNCSIMSLLGTMPQGQMFKDGVAYTFVDIEKEKELAIEHKAKSRAPLSQNTLRLLDYLLLNIDPDNHVRISGMELVDVFGTVVNVIGYLQAIRQIEIHTRIINTRTQKSVHHRFGIVESVSFDDDFGCKDWGEVRPDTIIDIKLYNHFCDIFIGHIIPDYEISNDYIALAHGGIGATVMEEIADDARAKIEMEKTERSAEEEEDEADDDSDYFDDQEEDQTEDQTEDQEYADNQGGEITVTLDDSQPILLSIRQLNRIYSSIPEDDYEIKYGVLVKYRGKGGDIGIPSQVETIGKGAFEGCEGLLSISIPDTVKYIGVAAFKDCANLVEVDIPLHLLRVVMRDIGAYFGGTQFVEYLARDGEIWKRYEEVRKAMEDRDMVGEDEDDQIEDLENDDQENADNQESGITVTIDDSQPILLSIRQLNRIYSQIPEEDYEIKYGVLLKYRGKGGDIGIPSQVIAIGKRAFEGCEGLLSISIPDTVKYIGVAAFKDCANLVEVDIPLRLLRVVMTDIGAYFGGTQFVDFLARDGEIWKRYEEVRKAMEEMVGEEEDELMAKPEDE